MRVLIVHLSDIHIHTAADVVLGRAEAIGRAVQSWCYEIDLCVIAVTGDIAYSGTETQYISAEFFLLEIEEYLLKCFKERGAAVPLHRVVVPGNHDCDFSDQGLLRQLVLEKFSKGSLPQIDKSIVDACTTPQEAYLAWSDAARHSGFALLSTQLDPRLGYRLTLEHAGQNFAFECFNTAWISQKHEINTLTFPHELIPGERSSAALTVALFHHPYGWMEPNAGRAFRKAIEARVDVILTGHEHEAGQVKTETSRGSLNNYLEGGLLQDSIDPMNSSFNCLLVDVGLRMQKFAIARWDGDLYDVEVPADWEPFRLNPARVERQFNFSPKAEQYLSDPELSLSHPGKEKVTLPDIYVFPDLKEVGLPNETGPTVRGDSAVDHIVGRTAALVIGGDTQSGKTSLAKMLMRRLREKGFVPVLVPSTACAYTGDRLRTAVEDAFLSQYEGKTRAAYQQLDSHQRVVIVDDYHELRLSKKLKQRWLRDLSEFAPRPILCGHDAMLDVSDLTGADAGTPLIRYQILPFGHRRRNRLVEQWLLLGSTNEADEAAVAKALANLTRTLDTLIGKNFVPAYPPYLLAVLQANEAATPVDLRASTHGYFYELFIRTALASGRTPIQYDILTAYLAYLAYALFLKRVHSLSIREAENIHRNYQALHHIDLDFAELRRGFVEQGILLDGGDEIGFRYKYIYYYFVASYLRDHLNVPGTKAEVAALTKQLHVEDSSNILLFLAHLSKDPLIVAEMLSTARGLYADATPVRFDNDVIGPSELKKLGTEVVVYRDGGELSQHRDQAMDALDEAEELDKQVAAVEDPMSPVVRIGTMLKTIQILGQIAKNFPGSLEGDIKTDIVRECRDLGLRALGSVFEMVHAERVGLLQAFTDMIRDAHPSYKDARIVERAKDTLVALTAMAGFGIVKRIALAIGSPELSQTYERVFDDETPARRLIALSVQLDQFGMVSVPRLEQMNRDFGSYHLAGWIMRSLCTEYFNLFPIKPMQKQAICRAIGITYEQIGATESGLLLRRPVKP